MKNIFLKFAKKLIKIFGGGGKYLYIPDGENKFSTVKNVVNSFCKKYGKCEHNELRIFILNDLNIQSNLSKLNEFSNLYKNIKIIIGDEENLEHEFLNSDYYVTNMSSYTVRYTCLADKYNLKIISGVDIPVF